MTTAQARTMASYNRWMNERLYETCARLPDAERKRDRGAFFKSIHGTLNHLLLADKIWLGRFQGEPYPVHDLAQQLYEAFAELRAEREATDRRIALWAAGLTDRTLAGELHFTSVVDAAPRRRAMWAVVLHFFNHQTHHRGQLTALLSQCGADYGVTDLIWLPELVPETGA